MRPLLLTGAGIALGLGITLPLAHGQLAAATSTNQTAVVSAAPASTSSAPPTPPTPTASKPSSTGPGRAGNPSVRPAAPAAATVTGPSVATRYGPVQVRLVLANGKITSVTALALPSRDRESRQINDQAGPLLAAETLKAQTAQIDTVSGASWTSGGYRTSVQAALDAARKQGLVAAA